MGKSKSKNKNRSAQASNTTNVHTSRIPVKQAASSTSSSFVSETSSLIHRTSDGTSELPTSSDGRPDHQHKLWTDAGRHDSALSSAWEGDKPELQPESKIVLARYWHIRPRRWWPCRAYRWTRDFGLAFGRALHGPRWLDTFMTLSVACLVMFTGYIAVELLLRLLQPVSAQTTFVDANCSIVYVTVPGPVITVSLINASPSNPAQGTYYFSVVNGTTEWMNSIAPPSHFSTLPTKTPDTTPVVSSISVTPSSSFSSSGLTSNPSTPPSIVSSATTVLSLSTSVGSAIATLPPVPSAPSRPSPGQSSSGTSPSVPAGCPKYPAACGLQRNYNIDKYDSWWPNDYFNNSVCNHSHGHIAREQLTGLGDIDRLVDNNEHTTRWADDHIDKHFDDDYWSVTVHSTNNHHHFYQHHHLYVAPVNTFFVFLCHFEHQSRQFNANIHPVTGVGLKSIFDYRALQSGATCHIKHFHHANHNANNDFEFDLERRIYYITTQSVIKLQQPGCHDDFFSRHEYSNENLFWADDNTDTGFHNDDRTIFNVDPVIFKKH
ncbi:hypothetical protein BDU57DRAFT_538382 [Ampelomyces quisqualis]|uniref:Uncharacterized protein n=1 Tax=Ampelomyces quisqualis TaxID=50730 RepID=A0A6A5QMY6_AMPQU|nr:hypothetical protein BDU57DRAFT_538382 [Ampelomyces quisqualis]